MQNRKNDGENTAEKSKIATKNIAYIGICTAVALILSYVEFLIPPIYPPFPMIKCGLSNIALLFAVYRLKKSQTFLIAAMKVAITAMLFGSVVSLAYSAGGAILSLAIMMILKKIDKFSCIGVSVCGAVAHNIGQILVAMVILKGTAILSYLPVLLFTGTVAGIIVGLIGSVLIKTIKSV